MSLDAMKQALRAAEFADLFIKELVTGSTNREVAKQVLSEAITALRAAIEQAQPDELMIWKSRAMSAERMIEKFMQPEQEPVFELGFGWLDDATKYPRGTKLYTTSPRQWQGLTDEEIKIIWRDIDGSEGMLMRFARAIEAKLKEKNT